MEIQEKYRAAMEEPLPTREEVDAVMDEAGPLAPAVVRPPQGCYTVICKKCTYFQQFFASTQLEGQMKAQAAGWKLVKGVGTVCKKCPA